MERPALPSLVVFFQDHRARFRMTMGTGNFSAMIILPKATNVPVTLIFGLAGTQSRMEKA